MPKESYTLCMKCLFVKPALVNSELFLQEKDACVIVFVVTYDAFTTVFRFWGKDRKLRLFSCELNHSSRLKGNFAERWRWIEDWRPGKNFSNPGLEIIEDWRPKENVFNPVFTIENWRLKAWEKTYSILKHGLKKFFPGLQASIPSSCLQTFANALGGFVSLVQDYIRL